MRVGVCGGGGGGGGDTPKKFPPHPPPKVLTKNWHVQKEIIESTPTLQPTRRCKKNIQYIETNSYT